MIVRPHQETMEMLIWASKWWYYDPATGMLHWDIVDAELVGKSNTMTATRRAQRRNDIYAGARAGHLSKHGWRYTIRNHVFLGPRLVWGIATGGWPPPDVAVMCSDGDVSNQRPSNLRLCSTTYTLAEAIEDEQERQRRERLLG